MALDPRLAEQSLARPLNEREAALALAVEAVFGDGIHDFAKVAEALQRRGVERPSGESAPWSETILQEELAAINASLDAAYETAGIGA